MVILIFDGCSNSLEKGDFFCCCLFSIVPILSDVSDGTKKSLFILGAYFCLFSFSADFEISFVWIVSADSTAFEDEKFNL